MPADYLAFIPGAGDAPTLEEVLGPPPPGYAGSSRAAASTGVVSADGSGDPGVFRSGVDSFDWIRLGWLALGLIVGWQVLRK